MIEMEDALTLHFYLNENANQPDAGLSGIEEYDNEQFVVLRNCNGILAVFVDTSNYDIDVNPITESHIETVQKEDWPKALKEEVQ